MPDSFNVIALISGGKDSLFSILHCLAHGHKIIALANLYPPSVPGTKDGEEGDDINSYMYQTVGHSIIPLYEEALGIPLYRQEILGSAVNTERDYSYALREGEEDETESLIPLLKKVIKIHPEANAISTGAILSTYQRTRVESIALRLGLTPLSNLWQYPSLPPYSQSGLLRDMAAVGQDARIIKVASGGLDQSFLWDNVADTKVIGRLGRAMARFGDNGDGAVLGEGGEFETLAVDGPGCLWKGRIDVESDGVVVGDGGNAIFRGKNARVVSKETANEEGLEKLRIPNMWDDEFKAVLDGLETAEPSSPKQALPTAQDAESHTPVSLKLNLKSTTPATLNLSNLSSTAASPTDQLHDIITALNSNLAIHSLTPQSISHVTILLRRITDFTTLNETYSTLFSNPNPPSRVTISCGDSMPSGVDVMLSAIVSTEKEKKRNGLHVQSRSYWAPANIGPYSQAISIPVPTSSDTSSPPEVVYLAGQIPLIPSTMELYDKGGFKGQTVLALQHLWRIGRAMNVRWWTAAVAYISSTASAAEAEERVKTAQQAWRAIHAHYLKTSEGDESDEEDEYIDPWDLKNRASHFGYSQFGGGGGSGGGRGGAQQADSDTTFRSPLPDAAVLAPNTTLSHSESAKDAEAENKIPPCFIIQVFQLPRSASIEWHSTGLSSLSSSTPSLTLLSPTPHGSVTSLANSPTRSFTLEICPSDDVGSVQHKLQELLGACDDHDTRSADATRAFNSGQKALEFEHATLYATASLQTLLAGREGTDWSDIIPGLQWVPCERVWGTGGATVLGVLVGRASVVR